MWQHPAHLPHSASIHDLAGKDPRLAAPYRNHVKRREGYILYSKVSTVILTVNENCCCMWILSSLVIYFAYIFVRVMSFSFNFFMFHDLIVNLVIPLYVYMEFLF